MALKTKRRPNRRYNSHVKLTKLVKEMVDAIENNEQETRNLVKDAEYLGIVNRVQVNKYLNMYMVDLFKQMKAVQGINAKILERLEKKKEIADPKQIMQMYLENRKLENDHLKLITELCRTQHFDLDLPEREILIIYRSLPDQVKSVFYNTIMEFVRQCPTIINALKENQRNLKKEAQLQ